ncbi:Tir chaperone family protein [Bordetella sp. 02P26C-1]|nr:Tir chaperone family protein [Bordetella sp. 02P26C-1]
MSDIFAVPERISGIRVLWRSPASLNFHLCYVELIVPSLSFTQLLSDLGQKLGIPSLTPTVEGMCQLAIDGRHLLQIVDVSRRGLILLSCPVGPSTVTPELAVLMARSNFMQAAGGAVACTAPDGRLLLQLGVAGSCPPETVLSAIESLIDEVEKWEVSLSRVPTAPRPRRRDALLHRQPA